MDSNVTRRRSDRAQLSVLLDRDLLEVVRQSARSRGVTISCLVERALEVECDVECGGGAGGGGGVAVSGGDSGHFAGPTGVDDFVVGAVGSGELTRGAAVPDWGAILEAGRVSKQREVVRDVTSQEDLDPLWEIA